MVKKWVVWVAVLGVVLTTALGIGKSIYDERLEELVYSRHSHLIKTARTLLHEHLMKVVQDKFVGIISRRLKTKAWASLFVTLRFKYGAWGSRKTT